MLSADVEKLDAFVEPLLQAARIPGAAVAVVAHGELLFAKGYGYRDRAAGQPMRAETSYPIASTTKAINAVLLGTLVDEGKLEWDAPVRRYLPDFRLQDPWISRQVTLRDLIVMRTGLPRHDWSWIDVSIGRAQLVERLVHLESSAGFRERFQYNNLTVTAAGHVAEAVTGCSWEELVTSRILRPLEMRNSGFAPPANGDVTCGYHENSQRELLLSERLATEATAPSGGAMYSTVEDMAKWMLFNLRGQGRPLLQPNTFSEITSPQIFARTDPSCPSPNAAYGMGWFVDTYNDRPRIAHGGYIHDVNSEVMLFPADGIGVVSFINFGFPALARYINQCLFDALMGFTALQTAEQKLELYEKKVADMRQRSNAVRHVAGTRPSHPLRDYAGTYEHPGYGSVEVQCDGESLILRRGSLNIPLQHWHYDAWIARDLGRFFLHCPHPFDSTSRMLFHTDEEGAVAALSLPLEPAVAPIRFMKCRQADPVERR